MAEIKDYAATSYGDHGFALESDNGCVAYVEWNNMGGDVRIQAEVPHLLCINGTVHGAYISPQKIPAFLTAVAQIDPQNIPEEIKV